MTALCDAGAIVDHERDEGGITPLFIAAQGNHPDCIRALCRAGSFVDRARTDGCITSLFMVSELGLKARPT